MQHQIDVKVTGYHNIKKTMLDKTTTFYHIEVKTELEGFQNNDKPLRVERRFNDFKQLHESLSINPDYKGYALPPLPQDNSYM